MISSRILVVDDEPGMLRSVERVLAQHYQVAGTRSPREAVRLAPAFRPDLAILDIQMPEMDGFQLMEELQALDSEMDVIFMTGSIHELDSKLIRAIRNDAFYFLQKPFDREVLLSLVDRCLKLRRLDYANRQHLLRMEREFRDARAFQESMLAPRSATVEGVSISAQYVSCSELAGDFYDYVFLPSGGAVILVADVSGHGASAAMLTGVVKSAFHSAGTDLYEPRCVVDRVASAIRAFGTHRFITLICARVQETNLEYVNAGHPPGILSRAGNPATLLEATGPLISPALVCSWEQRALGVDRGSDRLVLFTDAIVEAESGSGEYGLDRLIEEASRRPTEACALAEHILESVRQFAGGRPLEDDLTLVIADI
jgi:sigma-B regulation protein RsbU (phosphoserine phosphatase)